MSEHLDNDIVFFLAAHGPKLISEERMLILIKQLRRAREWLCVQVMSDLSKLSPREKQIVVSRFGLEGQETKTREELGKNFGVSAVRIRQIEARAFRKIRGAQI